MSHPFDTSAQSHSTSGDAFFVLNESRALFQRRLAELARKGGVFTPSVATAFTEALGEAHDTLASDKARDGFDQTQGLTASRITLMCDADLELDIRIGDIGRHLMEIGGSNLWRVHSRYMTLLNRPEMSPDFDPVGSEAITSGLWAICRASDIEHERKLDLLNRLEETFASELPVVYGELNELLASHNIEPAKSQITNRSSAAIAGAGNSPQGGSSKADPFSALQNALSAQFGGVPGGMGGGSGGASVAGSQAGATGNTALNAATLVMLNQLTTRLEQLQLSEIAAAGQPDSPPHAFKAADLDLPLGNPEAVALETLGYIFEAIFKTWDLPDTVKTAISRLQIPLLKLSIFDPSLFSDIKHPARQLINTMGRAAVGLPRNIDRSHPVSTQLWHVASTVAETLQGDASVLAAPIAELEALIASRDAEIQGSVEPFIAFLAAADAGELAAQLADRWLRDIEQQPSAQEIHDFVGRYWVKVMADAALEGGEDGALWLESKATVADLMWSVLPKPSADERKRLSLLVATLIKRINAGLDRIGLSQEERAPFLDACFNLQFATMRGSSPALVAPPARQAPAVTAVEIKVEAVGDQVLKTLAGGVTTAYRKAAGGVRAGQWLQFSMPGDEPLCGLVTWVSPQSGKLLLANPDWQYAVALTADILEAQMQRGEALVVSSRALFDMAAEQALSQIAKG